MLSRSKLLRFPSVLQCLANRKFSSFPSKTLDPEQIVAALDRHIIGQYSAKRSVAIAFRNRMRRRLLPLENQKEIMPANILMKGPTGCGKTEISRRIANLTSSPFIKVEATRYTEIGIVGANTNTMVKDLLDMAINMQREQAMADVKEVVENKAESSVLEHLSRNQGVSSDVLKDKFLDGKFDDQAVQIPFEVQSATVEAPRGKYSNTDEFGGGMPPMEDLSAMMSSMMKMFPRGGADRQRNVEVTVREAIQCYRNFYYNKYIDEKDLVKKAIENTEQNGIIFIDEIDKLASSSDATTSHGTRSQLREGVQKELLTLLEGALVNTKFGPVRTHHILFIAAGAFHQTQVGDLMPELQGRLPVRVELKPLTELDLRRILAEKQFNLVKEAKSLLGTEGVDVVFTEDGVNEIARQAHLLNTTKGNIGARRLTNVMHTVLEDISFLAHRMKGTEQTVDGTYVKNRMKVADPTGEENLSKYII